MKRLVLLAVCVLSVGGLLASGAASSGATTSKPLAVVHISMPKAAHAGKFLACMVTDTGGIDDRSFNASSWQGVQGGRATPTITGKYLQSSSESDYVPNINAFIAEKCGIIVTVGFLMGTDTQTAAKKNPKQKFAIVDYTYSPAIKNIDALVFDTVQDGFLGGYLAAGYCQDGMWSPPSAASSCRPSPSTWTVSRTACSTTTRSTPAEPDVGPRLERADAEGLVHR